MTTSPQEPVQTEDVEDSMSDEMASPQSIPAAGGAYGNADPSTENRTSASGRLPNDPGPEVTGGGVDDLVEENLTEQQRPEDETRLTSGEAEYNQRAGQ
jgi:hypothetical protein